MASVENCCATCKWAKFSMTNHAKPRPKGPGECLWPIAPFALPVSITGGHLSAERFHKMCIWPDYINCPTWEAKEVK